MNQCTKLWDATVEESTISILFTVYISCGVQCLTRTGNSLHPSPPKLLFNNKWVLYLEHFSMRCPSPRDHGARKHSKVKWVYRAAAQTTFSKMQANVSAFSVNAPFTKNVSITGEVNAPVLMLASVSQYLYISTGLSTRATGGKAQFARFLLGGHGCYMVHLPSLKLEYSKSDFVQGEEATSLLLHLQFSTTAMGWKMENSPWNPQAQMILSS